MDTLRSIVDIAAFLSAVCSFIMTAIFTLGSICFNQTGT